MHPFAYEFITFIKHENGNYEFTFVVDAGATSISIDENNYYIGSISLPYVLPDIQAMQLYALAWVEGRSSV